MMQGMTEFVTLVGILTRKCWKLIVRRPGNRYLFVISITLVFGGLYLMWLLTNKQILTMFTSEPYAKLAFDFVCDPTDSKSNLHCEPYSGNLRSQELTPGDLLLNWLKTGQPVAENSKENLKALELISSIMMNGLPLVGLDDFVHISDFTNKYVGKELQEKLMTSVTLRDQFDSFLNIRQKRLILAPENACTREFYHYMLNHTHIMKDLRVEMSSASDFIVSSDCCENVWAIIEIQPIQKWSDSSAVMECDLNPTIYQNSSFSFSWDDFGFSKAEELLQFSFDDKASVTIRMHPSAIPDTRNYEWTPLKGTAPRQQSGELLYFTSGFLTLQLELQNFIRYKQYSSITSFTTMDSLQDLDSSFVESKSEMMEVVKMLMTGNSKAALKQNLMDSKLASSNFTKPSFYFPLYHRAFPTHEYQESHFWRLFGTIMTIALVVLFSLPAAIAIGNFQREMLEGQIDMLSTLPKVSAVHSLLAWCAASSFWLLGLFLCSLLFFHAILVHGNSWIPCLSLLLLGLTLGPIAALLSKVINKPDTLVLSIPIFTFIMLLPGIVYFDLAFDIQRSPWKEALLCLFPPSGVALILRLCFSNEAIGVGVSWTHKSPVSETMVSFYLLILVMDYLLYMVLASSLFRRQPFHQVQHNITCCKNSSSGSGNVENEQSLWILLRQLREDIYAFLGLSSYEFIHSIDQSSPLRRRATTRENSTLGQKVPTPYLRMKKVSKSYQTAGAAMPVLSDIETELDSDTITVLLGSNGAGKTTFMRIIAGLDPTFTGSIDNLCTTMSNKRLIGWCPQNDALFDLLTIQEHMLLYLELLAASDRDSSRSAAETSHFVNVQLQSLGLLEHGAKAVNNLSGGMKRRLALALSFLGDPKILLLDEPTSGCDSWTREMVRKDILARKDNRAVLISTHHSDDIEVLADRVWFLNERALEIDEEVTSLINKTANNDFGSAASSWKDRPLKFVSRCEQVDSLFRKHFGETNAKLWTDSTSSLASSQSNSSVHLEKHYLLPDMAAEDWHVFLQELDRLVLTNWSLETCTVFDAICSLYSDARPADDSTGNSSHVNTTTTADTASERETGNKFLRQVHAVLWVRWIEVRKYLLSFLCTHVLIPFLVISALCYGCRDAQYPKVEITSDNLNGVGEICMATSNRNVAADQPVSVTLQHAKPSFIVQQPTSTSRSDAASVTTNGSFAALITVMIPTSTVSWRGQENSNLLWKDLFGEYFQHESQRWGALVVEDVDGSWIESTVILEESNMNLSPREAFQELRSMHSELCEHINSTALTHDQQRYVGTDSLLASELKFCDDNPALTIRLNRNNTIDEAGDGAWYLAVKSHYEMRSNITLLSNVTTDHAAPVFVKEVLTPVHDAIWGLSSTHNAQLNDSLGGHNQRVIEMPIYRLFSFPLPESNIINRRFIERGYLGSMMTVMYLMLTSVSSVRMVAKLRACKVKRQLHLSGLPISTYWLANAIADSFIVFLSLLAVFAAIGIGGKPVKSFFWNFSPFPGLLFLCALALYAVASVAANFALVVLSEDQLASQLFVLITTLSGGVFLKMYLDRQHGVFYEDLSNLFIFFSPTFSFSTIMFDMFSIYTHSITAAVQSGSLQHGVNQRFTRIVHCMFMMALQSVIYLAVCIAVDKYVVLWQHFVNQWRWLFSAQNMGYLVAPQSVASAPSHDNDESNEVLEKKLTRAAGERMIHLLSLHPHYRVGIFPLIQPSTYNEAGRYRQPGTFQRSDYYQSVASSDIEMEPILHHESDRAKERQSTSHEDVQSAVNAKDLCVGYPEQNRLSLCNLNVSIAMGEKVAIMGMNGGGKTTFFETCALASKVPMAGQLYIRDHNVVSDGEAIINTQCMSYVPQEEGLLDFCTVQQSLELLCRLQGRSYGQEFNVVGDSMDGFLPLKFMNYPTHALSGGTKKKLLVRLANIGKPDVLLMDECTSGVDPIAAEKIVDYLKENFARKEDATCQMKKKQSLVFSSHRIDESFAICDKVLMLVDGQVYIDGPASMFLNLMMSYYQIDILLATSTTNDQFLRILEEDVGSTDLLERIVVYHDQFIRLTLHKSRFPVSRLWALLMSWQKRRLVNKFYFRAMEMEEILAVILSTAQSE